MFEPRGACLGLTSFLFEGIRTRHDSVVPIATSELNICFTIQFLFFGKFEENPLFTNFLGGGRILYGTPWLCLQ